MKNILITGGASFIGSHVANHFYRKYPNYNIYVLDKLTYAANPDNLDSGILLITVDICNYNKLESIFVDYEITDVIHLAAESHVDNSIAKPDVFIKTNIVGTHNLLRIAKDYSVNKFYHVSTDEVYGHLGLDDDAFTEETPYAPRSPYSASKASSDHLVRSYFHTFNLPILISNCSNNYGPHQHEEKLIPKVISNLRDGKTIPVYGTGENIRDWLYVGDHAEAIDRIFHEGVIGETYNIGGSHELTNLELITQICCIYAQYKNGGVMPDEVDIPIEYVEDRKGHDMRYAINSSKLWMDLKWEATKDFDEGIKETIKYYENLDN